MSARKKFSFRRSATRLAAVLICTLLGAVLAVADDESPATEAKKTSASQSAPGNASAKPGDSEKRQAEKSTSTKKSTGKSGKKNSAKSSTGAVTAQTKKKESESKKQKAKSNSSTKSTDDRQTQSNLAGKPQNLAAGNAGSEREMAKDEMPSGEMEAKDAAGEKRPKQSRLELKPFPRPEVLPDPKGLAAKVDGILQAELQTARVDLAPLAADDDFLRRVSFDLAGVSPSPEQVTLFAIDPDPEKRAKVIDRLLASDAYAENWSRYWRDVLYFRAVEQRARIGQRTFEKWMAEQLKDNVSWADIATRLLTATGDVREFGETALIYAQRAEADEVAAETARVFLGIQLQCANCHDHPSDKWKRDEFHALAAFFPRMQVRPIRDGEQRSFELVSFNSGRGSGNPRADFAKMQENADQFIKRMDRDNDGKLAKKEIRSGQNQLIARLFDMGDSDKDGVLTADEIRKIPPPPERRGQGTAEYFMPDLQNPQSAGTKFDPSFFLTGESPGTGKSDIDRRLALAKYITAPENKWFAKAFVNRMWAQMMGEGFTMPVDDMGPERTVKSPEVLEALAAGFTTSGYDIKWLLRTIASTQTYQRQIRPREKVENPPAFASAMPTKLRADQLYDAIVRVLGVDDLGTAPGRPRRAGVPRYGDASPRGQFHALFGFDPSATPEEQLGNLPQALFLMNSPLIHLMIAGKGETRLSTILSKHSSNDDALRELYLLVHAREPSEKELQVCRDYIRDVKNRQDAFEDILWSLINSTEFQTRR